MAKRHYHRAWHQAKSLGESKVAWVLVVILFFLGGLVLSSGVMYELDASHSGGAQVDVKLGSVVSQVWIANQSGDYVQASFTGTGSTITIATPQNFTLAHMVVFDKNPNYNLVKFVNTSLFFYNVNVATSATGGLATNLSAVDVVAGLIDNSTQTTAISDKQISDQAFNQTVYSSSMNNLNSTIHLNPFDMVRMMALAHKNTYVGYVANFNTTHKASTVSSTISIKLTADWYSQSGYNFYIDSMTGAFLVAIVVGILLVPRAHIQREEGE